MQKFCDYDDICTDLLIDKVGFWSQTHKMAKNYKGKRAVSEEEVLTLIRNMVKGNQSLAQAAEALLKYASLG